MFPYSLQQLASIMNARLSGSTNHDVRHIWIDTRHIVHSENGIFFALKGAQLDGHDFLESAYQKGIRNFVVSEVTEPLPDAGYLLVENPLKALQTWAAYHRKQFDYPVVGITGSNGKTIVKEWVYQLLYQKIKLIRSPKSYNSQIGVALSVLEMIPGIDLSILELGISKPGEMKNLAGIANPDIAVITNVGEAHAQFFTDRKEQIKEKIKIASNTEIIIFPNEDTELKSALYNAYPNRKFISFGKSESADIQLVEAVNGFLRIKASGNEIEFPFEFTDEASVANALCCLAVLSALNFDLNEFTEEFKHIVPVEMRLEILNGEENTVIINDAFNSDLSSVPIALNVLNQQTKPHKTLILTDILQNRQKGEELYSEVAGWVNAYDIQKVILIGDEIQQYSDKFRNFKHAFRTTAEFLQHFRPSDFAGEAILLKGARRFKLEQISKKFESKSHDTILEVNLQHLLENVNYFRSLLSPKTKLMCMVKAFGYGTGGFEIAQALESHNVDYLGVAYADEGAELRRKGIKAPIMVMNPEQNSYDTLIDYQLEAEIYSFRMLDKFTAKLNEKEIQMAYPVHLKLNTGMNRLGFKPDQISELIQRLADNPYVRVRSVFSHLATSDMPSQSEFVRQQFQTFEEMNDKIAFNLGFQPLRHILNSSGILNYPEYQMDMVRLGIGMYGIANGSEHKKHLKNVVTFKTVISQITDLKEGETVSYGRTFRADKPIRIATLPVGYADGIKRMLGNRGEVAVNGKIARMVGTVCMDMIMVDVTDIVCNEGDEVIIFGEFPTLESFAEKADTISYEILTSISSRVKRVYLKE